MKLTSVELLLSCLLTLFGIILGHENGVVEVNAAEGSDAILPCSLSTKERITSKVFDWKKDHQKEVFFYEAGKHYNDGRSGQDEQFEGRVSHFPEELKSGNASIIIRNTRMEDSGVYTCFFPHLQPSQLFQIKLVVGGAATKPYVKTLNQTQYWALLQCEVRGAFPKPKLHWQDSDGNILHAEEPKETERGGRYDVILNITVTKTDNYRCVATQEKINHQVDAETYVYIHEKLVGDKSSHGAGMFVGGLCAGALTVAAVLGLFEVAKRIKHCKKAAATKSSVMIVDETKELKLMSFEVPNVTPQSLWQDSNGHVLPDEDHRFSEKSVL
ncbi:butyrophilin subfamily 2 member A2-like isoform X2 [Thunnus maccoyii]|uniref:butyrophilin subfamily 2 member A2-like isoform X2 n=1 Tax=Thunnus maccoyii TaxID=8240 RepID=UPI001C4C3D9D|nr:butyrophilin subfamily 2 member A2-like isoform X2 [Thunnus maccoyii]